MNFGDVVAYVALLTSHIMCVLGSGNDIKYCINVFGFSGFFGLSGLFGLFGLFGFILEIDEK